MSRTGHLRENNVRRDDYESRVNRGYRAVGGLDSKLSVVLEVVTRQ